MNTGVEEIIQRLNRLQSMEGIADIEALNDCIERLREMPNPERSIKAVLNIFERFPDKDGYGVFWNILHFLETIPNYETKLIESVRRQPSEFSLRLINRLINGGVKEVNGECLLDLLEEIANNESYSESARKYAQSFYNIQKQGGIKHQSDSIRRKPI
jgi:hypothetical protein